MLPGLEGRGGAPAGATRLHTAGCDLHTEAEGSQEFDSRRNKLLSLLGERGWGRKLGLEAPGENKILRRQLALSGSAEQIAEGF